VALDGPQCLRTDDPVTLGPSHALCHGPPPVSSLSVVDQPQKTSIADPHRSVVRATARLPPGEEADDARHQMDLEPESSVPNARQSDRNTEVARTAWPGPPLALPLDQLIAQVTATSTVTSWEPAWIGTSAIAPAAAGAALAYRIGCGCELVDSEMLVTAPSWRPAAVA